MALETQVGGDGLGVGDLLVEVREDRAQARGIRRQLVHVFDSRRITRSPRVLRLDYEWFALCPMSALVITTAS